MLSTVKMLQHDQLKQYSTYVTKLKKQLRMLKRKMRQPRSIMKRRIRVLKTRKP